MLPADARSGTTVGKYRLHEIVGRGGMGVVYRGEHVYIGKEVAVKILHDGYGGREEAIKRFLREARAASLINHPNIVTVTDFGKGQDGTVFFVMELLRGYALDAVLQREGQLGLLRAITILNQVAAALAAAHSKGIIHRDLKPENVMLIPREGRRELLRSVDDESGAHIVSEREKSFDFVKILDFGVAKVRDVARDNASRSITQSGVVFGTPEYMAPETARVGISDVRTDIYALGVMFYEMLTGSVPFTGDSAMDVMVKQVNMAVEPPRQRAPRAEITVEAERLILRALAKNPDERPQTMEDFHRDLQKCYGEVRFRRVIKTPGGLPAQPMPPDAVELEWAEITPPEAVPVPPSAETNGQASPIPLLRRKAGPAPGAGGQTPSPAALTPRPGAPGGTPSPVVRSTPRPSMAEGTSASPGPVLLTKKKERPAQPVQGMTPDPVRRSSAGMSAQTPAVPPRPQASGTPPPHPLRTPAPATAPSDPGSSPPAGEPGGRRRKTLPMGSEVGRPSSPQMPAQPPVPESQGARPVPPGAVPVVMAPSPSPVPRLPQTARRPLHGDDPNGDVITPPPSFQRSGR